MGVIKGAIGDATLTSIWVFIISTLRIVATEVALLLGLQPFSLLGLFITTILNTLYVLTISFIGRVLGGASFNPSTSVSFYTAGLRPDSSLASMAVRFPAQAAGGAVGAKALLMVVPPQYKDMLKGPFLKVDLHTGAVAEGVLTFTHNLAILFVMLRGPKNPFFESLFALCGYCGFGYSWCWLHWACHEPCQCLWMGLCEQQAQHLGAVLCLLDMPFCRG